ncbi:MAG TPA: hydroxymethylbilane synthase [Catalimonadaceae bacterium]|nr:hydroxymethylbilane synthase [Catalimonadaceae bacterium]
MQTLVIATRSSPLALWQANFVADSLQRVGFQTRIQALETIGDKKLEVSLSKIGEKGVFTQELEQLLIRGEAHLAVHSAKDMPSKLPEELEILAFTERENPIDVLVSPNQAANINQPLRIGTSSTRRVAILKRYFPHIETVTVRGNLQTRFRKMEEGHCDALLLAFAGVNRMGFSESITQELDPKIFTPAVGQGSLAIEVGSGLSTDLKIAIRAALNHEETNLDILAERAFLRVMDGGCSVPVFGYSRIKGVRRILSGGIVSLDGLEEIRFEGATEDIHSESAAIDLGVGVAREILLRGGDAILSKIKQNLRH